VTSGIDFGLRIVDQILGRTTAEVAQLMLEYAPEPPFNAGEPSTAPAIVVGAVQQTWAPLMADVRAAVEGARANF
jgi:cyclohexyl-isocyanide hydratase